MGLNRKRVEKNVLRTMKSILREYGFSEGVILKINEKCLSRLNSSVDDAGPFFLSSDELLFFSKYNYTKK